jgi:hypothetical protein
MGYGCAGGDDGDDGYGLLPGHGGGADVLRLGPLRMVSLLCDE